MEKASDAFRTISEVSKWLGVPTHVLRFWESRFPQVSPVKRAGGRRYYRPEDMRLLGGIKTLLHDQGQSIKSVQDRLEAEGLDAVMDMSPDMEWTAPIDGEADPAGVEASGRQPIQTDASERRWTPVPEAVPDPEQEPALESQSAESEKPVADHTEPDTPGEVASPPATNPFAPADFDAALETDTAPQQVEEDPVPPESVEEPAPSEENDQLSFLGEEPPNETPPKDHDTSDAPPQDVTTDEHEQATSAFQSRRAKRNPQDAPQQGFFFNDMAEDVQPPPLTAEDKVDDALLGGGHSALDALGTNDDVPETSSPVPDQDEKPEPQDTEDEPEISLRVPPPSLPADLPDPSDSAIWVPSVPAMLRGLTSEELRRASDRELLSQSADRLQFLKDRFDVAE
ncbi:MAG: MerR family transcriptional regulator [Pseudomonadota bacterium]